MFTSPLLLLGASSLGFATGSVFLKRFADNGAVADLMMSFGIFAIANLFFAQILARGLGQGVVLSSMTQILLVSGIGALFFGERLALNQVAGLAFAVLSIWLICGASSSAPAGN